LTNNPAAISVSARSVPSAAVFSMATVVVATGGEDVSLLRQPAIHSRQLSAMSMQVIHRIDPLRIGAFILYI
jgi:hypothetical protein